MSFSIQSTLFLWGFRVAVGAQTVCRLSWKFLRASPCACHAGAGVLLNRVRMNIPSLSPAVLREPRRGYSYQLAWRTEGGCRREYSFQLAWVLLEPPARAYAKPLRRFINKHFSFTDFKDVKSRKGAKAYSQHTVNTVNRQFLFPFAFFLYTEDIQALSAPRLPHRARLTRRAP